MSSLFKTKEFKDLEKEWYDKLAKDGFKDLERQDRVGKKEERLKNGSVEIIQDRYTLEQFKIKEEYYRVAGQFLHNNKFKCSLDRLVWSLHSEGMSIRNIIKKLKKKGRTAYKDLIHGIIKRLADEMKTNVTKR